MQMELPLSELLTYIGLTVAVLIGIGALVVLTTNRRMTNHRHRRWYSVLAYICFLVTIAVLAISSFGSLLQFGHLSGYALMAHVTAAGLFVFLLLLISLFYLPSGATPQQPGFTGDQRWWVARWSAWALVLSSLLAAGTMIFSMQPLLGTSELSLVVTIHRYAGLAVVVAAIFHCYALLCTRAGLR